ncbi:hypothetical protein B0H66DRAFT_644720 [Apodospora peruviana]|uniref:GPI inositol-deacylase n=1 Tax=Apodospora peruviana TaxID=516989 RepID=A0AAE0LZF8_9PEZI|nr:hypothetical protein B0H66DRAFT_644720 [Apodospora peruviana]
MSQLRKKPFPGFLSRSTTDKSFQSQSLTRSDTSSSLSLSSLGLSDNEKGPLGLTTLHEPPASTTSVADIVFIHGLGGGSRKSWSYSPNPDHFWPLAWLPVDKDFPGVRIHTFGYNADWGDRRQSILNIRAIAQSLLGALRNHPEIRRTSTRIILVGHSMGGCVAKMVYILACQDPAASDLATRMHSMFFLGTPHRGSEMAAVLESMLAVAWGKKPFVTDLIPNSEALAAINDTFRHLAPGLRLWSFYETLPVRAAGVMNRIVVERHSATLGYHNEEIAAMEADHRHVCKFDTPEDPNYKMLRNALLTAVDLVRAGSATPDLGLAVSPVRTEYGTEIKPLADKSVSHAQASAHLRTFLDLLDSLEGDFTTLQLLKQPGSCQWFTKKSCFTSWQAGRAPGILWLMGRPAAGKSVLASHVIELLQPPKAFCSYFIFKHGEAGKSTLSECFRSLAFQMAMQDEMVRDTLLRLASDGLVWDRTDDASVWRRLFTSTIFRLPSISRHFWVVDGVDECTHFNAFFTKRFLATLPEGFRMFATSRGLEEIERGVAALGSSRAQVYALSEADTMEDMRLFLTTRLTELGRFDDVEDRDCMCEKVLGKSSGSFLWTRLVLQEFENMWTEEGMDDVLREVPADLHQLYSRMVHSIEVDRRKLELARSILTCVVLASRPLSVDELRCIVKLDVNQTLQNVVKAIPDLCGQLVFIDQVDHVHLIHETAREFLIVEDPERQLVIVKRDGHTRLAGLLLQYLSSSARKTPQSKSQQGSGRLRGFGRAAVFSTPTPDLSLLDYASNFFSVHLYRATSENDGLMDDLCSFLKADTILSWVEHIAKSGDLACLTRTATNMREYLTRRMKYTPPTHPSVQLVDSWVTDLIRVAAKFRAQLLACPSSIHCLIPPLCPSSSIIFRTFAKEARPSPVAPGLAIKGLSSESWDDCLIRLDFRKGQATTVAHGDSFFAIGLSAGQISVYDFDSVQHLRRMTHPERVKILQFGHDDQHLASCGTKHLVVWDPKSGIMMHSFALQSPALGVSFLGADEILCAFQSSQLSKWILDTEEHDSVSWKEAVEEDDQYQTFVHGVIPSQPPSRTAFLTTTDSVLLAVGYRSHPVLIWNALELELLGICDPSVDNNGINCMVFNPNLDIPVLVVSYQDGSLCIFDYLTMELRFMLPEMYANIIACSQDGRSLVTGSNQGLIEVFDFERGYDGDTTLTPIYRTSHPLDDAIRGIAFSADGSRFVDVRGRQGRVWAPAALVRKSSSEGGSSVVESAPAGDVLSLLTPKPTGMLESLEDPEITSSLVATTSGAFVVAGKRSGEVVLFSTADAKQLSVLYQHGQGASVLSIALGESQNLVISADDSGRVLMMELDLPLDSRPAAMPISKGAHILLDRRFGGTVTGLLSNPTADRLLVSGRHSDELWAIPSGTIVGETRQLQVNVGSGMDTQERDLPAPSTKPNGLPFRHPSDSRWFVVVLGDIARVFSWSDFTEVTPAEGLHLQRVSTTTQTASSSQEAYAGAESVPEDLWPTGPQNNIGINWETATATYHVGPGFVIELLRPSLSLPPCLYLWSAAGLTPSSSSSRSTARSASEPGLVAVGPALSDIVGIVGQSTLVFLDVNLWVCSTELQSVALNAARPTIGTPRSGGSGSAPSSTSSSRRSSAWSTSSLPTAAMTTTAHARRHFFALSEWRSATGAGPNMRCTLATSKKTPSGRSGSVSSSRDVVFANSHGIVVVKGGLEFSESVNAVPISDGFSLGVVGGGSNKNNRLMNGTFPVILNGGQQVTGPPGGGGGGGGRYHDVWSVVAGSMHRRSSNW